MNGGKRHWQTHACLIAAHHSEPVITVQFGDPLFQLLHELLRQTAISEHARLQLRAEIPPGERYATRKRRLPPDPQTCDGLKTSYSLSGVLYVCCHPHFDQPQWTQLRQPASRTRPGWLHLGHSGPIRVADVSADG
jgi:hypothetical protein